MPHIQHETLRRGNKKERYSVKDGKGWLNISPSRILSLAILRVIMGHPLSTSRQIADILKYDVNVIKSLLTDLIRGDRVSRFRFEDEPRPMKYGPRPYHYVITKNGMKWYAYLSPRIEAYYETIKQILDDAGIDPEGPLDEIPEEEEIPFEFQELDVSEQDY